ncbi:MAG: helix-turn-helix domain-containing protein [Candidatus Merdivicinus sp.]
MVEIDFSKRTKELMKQHGNITEYRLAKESAIPQSTLSNLLNNNSLPNFITLETLCRYFGITLSQFFFDSEQETLYPVTENQQEMLEKWLTLTPEQQKIIMDLIAYMNDKK